MITTAEEAERNATAQDAEAAAIARAIETETARLNAARADRKAAHRMATRKDRPLSHPKGRARLARLDNKIIPAIERRLAALRADHDHYTADAARLRTLADTHHTPQETPAMPVTDSPKHYTATGPDHRPLTRGAEVSENGRVASFLRVASPTEILVEWSWLNRREIIAADRVGITITANGPQEPRAVLSTDHRRCEHRKSLTHDHAPTCPVYADGLTAEHCACHHSDARCEEQQRTATPVTLVWTHTLRGHHNATATINGRTYRITHLSNADRTRGDLGDHLAHLPADDGHTSTLVARTWGLADLLGALADHAGAAPGPLALAETGRRRLNLAPRR
jgi:hypothetical protein